MTDQQYDTEITLGVGKLLGLFVMLVILCGIFLGLGYSLGKSSVKQEGLLTGDALPAGTVSTAAKPGASQAAPAPKPTTEPAAEAAQKADKSDSGASEHNPSEMAQAPEMKPAALAAGGYVVQVAAVSKKEDAEALQQALQHKSYPVVVTSMPTDKLFHVQIGPFADLKDAESMKAKLAADGYNAIVKK